MRIGGPHVGKAVLGLVVNSDNVILDDIWSWRADHGVAGSFGWTVSPADTGLVVNGDNVTATGLFVEHYKKYNVIWNGENGKTVFFQNEMPYDPPNQTAWREGPVLGYAGYKVADTVQKHELWGGGSYIFTEVDPSIHATRAFEVPERAGVKMHHLLTVQLLAGVIDHVINNTGDPTPTDVTEPSFVVDFPAAQQVRRRSPARCRPATRSAPIRRPPPRPPRRTRQPHQPPRFRQRHRPTRRPHRPTDNHTDPDRSDNTPTNPTTTPTVPTGPTGAAPSNLRGTATSNSVTLTWSGDASATYDILRGEDGVKIGSVTGTTFTDGGLNLNTPYVYSVRGAGVTTPQIVVTPGVSPSTPPTTGGTSATGNPTPPTTTTTPTTTERRAVQPAQDRPDVEHGDARLERFGHRQLRHPARRGRHQDRHRHRHHLHRHRAAAAHPVRVFGARHRRHQLADHGDARAEPGTGSRGSGPRRPAVRDHPTPGRRASTRTSSRSPASVRSLRHLCPHIARADQRSKPRRIVEPIEDLLLAPRNGGRRVAAGKPQRTPFPLVGRDTR